MHAITMADETSSDIVVAMRHVMSRHGVAHGRWLRVSRPAFPTTRRNHAEYADIRRPDA